MDSNKPVSQMTFREYVVVKCHCALLAGGYPYKAAPVLHPDEVAEAAMIQTRAILAVLSECEKFD